MELSRNLVKYIRTWHPDKWIIVTNGCFDILHGGHIDFLQRAKELASPSLLIVFLNSDSSVKQLKGNDRPILSQDDRMKILLSLKMIKYVVIFNSEQELADCYKDLQPDILVKGDEYQDKPLTGSEFAVSIVLLPHAIHQSTTELIQRCQHVH